MFRIGESVIYPAHGLAQVEAIKEQKVGDNTIAFYVLRVTKKNLAVMVPTNNESKVGLRPVINSTDVPRVLDILSQRPTIPYTQWHHRYSDNFEKLKTGSIFLAAEVVRDLAILRKRKNLAIKESRMMDNAWNLLISEISFATHVTEREAEKLISNALQIESDTEQQLKFAVAH